MVIMKHAAPGFLLHNHFICLRPNSFLENVALKEVRVSSSLPCKALDCSEFVCGLFNDAVCISECVVLNGRIISEKLTGEDRERSGEQ
jgi:hypothetical protein